MKTQDFLWLVIALPLAVFLVGLFTRDAFALEFAGMYWLVMLFNCSGRQRIAPIFGLMLLTVIGGLVIWSRW